MKQGPALMELISVVVEAGKTGEKNNFVADNVSGQDSK